MVKKYIAGIDIGTTNIKGVLYSTEGDLVSSGESNYESYSPKENYHEQNPDDWVNGFVEVLGKLLTDKEIKENLEALSFSTQGGTVVPVDREFNALYRAMTWLDRRSEKMFSNNQFFLSKNVEFYNKTGWRLDSNISFGPLYWLKENKPDIFNKIYKILYVNDYVLKKITDTNCQDPSNASITLFYNILDGKWDKEILDLIGLKRNNFSEVKASGEVVGYLKKSIRSQVGINSKVKIINGGHDQYCAAIGAGILNESEILLSTGTAWVIFKMLNRPLLDKENFFSVGRNIINNKFGLIYSIPAAGASIKWFAINLMNLASESELFRIENKNIKKLSSIRNNLIFHPYLTGAFGPDFNIREKASFTNIEIGHIYLDFIKAMLEGIGFQLKKILNVLKEKGIKAERIKMVGGGAKSKIWPKIISDIVDLNIFVPENTNENFAAKGAAIIAGYGSDIFSSIEEGYNKLKSEFKITKPEIENVRFYQEKFKLF